MFRKKYLRSATKNSWAKLQKSRKTSRKIPKKLTQSDDNYFSFGIKYLRTAIKYILGTLQKTPKNRKKLRKKTTENLARKLKNLERDECEHIGDNSPNR